MSASLLASQLSVFADQPSALRRQAARPAPSSPDKRAESAPAFGDHLGETDAPPRPARQAHARPRPERPAATDRPLPPARPEHPADPRSTRPDEQPQPHASDRARARADDHARFRRDSQPDKADAPCAHADRQHGDEASEATPAADDAALLTAADDPALTVETALAADAIPADADAQDEAAKQDGALAAALLPAPTVAPTAMPAPVQAAADPAAASATAATYADLSIAAGGMATASRAVTKSGASPDAASDAPDESASDEASAAAEPPRATPAAEHGKPAWAADSRNPNAAEPSPRARPHQATELSPVADSGPKPHAAPLGLAGLTLTPMTADATMPAPAPALPQPRMPDAVALQAVPLTIGLKALDGAREFEIRLDPAELGRVDVKLTISEDGRVQASLVVDRVETLALLQRDARTLERAFDQAGLTADANSIQFSLRQDNDAQRNAERERGERFDGAASEAAPAVTALPERPIQLYRGFVRDTAVDIRV